MIDRLGRVMLGGSVCRCCAGTGWVTRYPPPRLISAPAWSEPLGYFQAELSEKASGLTFAECGACNGKGLAA